MNYKYSKTIDNNITIIKLKRFQKCLIFVYYSLYSKGNSFVQLYYQHVKRVTKCIKAHHPLYTKTINNDLNPQPKFPPY